MIIDIVVAFILLLLGGWGVMTGLSKKLLSFFFLITSIFLTFPLYPFMKALLPLSISSNIVVQVFIFLATLFCLFIVFMFFSKKISRVFSKSPSTILGRIIGGSLGLIMGLLFLGGLTYALQELAPSLVRSSYVQTSLGFKACNETATFIKKRMRLK